MAASNSIGRFFNRLFSSKKFTMVFSLVFAFIFWLVIMIDQYPTRERTFTDVSLGISLENTTPGNRGLSMVSDISMQKFSVTVSGPNYVVSSLKKDDFVLSVDLTKITEADTYTLNVVAHPNGGSSDYEFLSISPSTVRLTFDRVEDKKFSRAKNGDDVNDILEISKPDVDIADGYIVDPLFTEDPFNFLADTSDGKNNINSITINGPKKTLDQINSVKVVAKHETLLEKTDSYDSDLLLCNIDGKVLYTCVSNGKSYDVYQGKQTENTEPIDPSNPAALRVTDKNCLKLQIPILKLKSLKIQAMLLDSDVTSKYRINPSKVWVCGDPDTIDGLSTDDSAVLSLQLGTQSDRYKLSDLELPNAGLKLLSSKQDLDISDEIITVSLR
ncbi:MAG: CdaR family protein [Clostridia bacterium]|nr:CdaR family protein [Clostridia bacterium]